ncbi:hypothetical protein [uncultured Rikenella sp.]|uniref:hypothetical protein n=1 Tax=uncultured Rikenella sp. TaxID=368003 RepID=UPI0025D38A04|nr:hypothetical protein [uncultured Rikenella sp.]
MNPNRGSCPCLSRPAPGFRDNDRQFGLLWRCGSVGYIWSASTEGTQGITLGFYVTYLNPANADHRSRGLQLRCLSE